MIANSRVLIIIIVVVVLVVLPANSINMNTTLNYTDCTPGRNCLECLNQYICSKCAPFQKCCPKRCVTCNNDTTCAECEPGYQLASDSQKGWTFCANSDKYTNIDYHRIQTPNAYPISTKCEKGYYYETNIKFCEKCRVENCQLCKDSIHCFICESGFLLFNGLCLTFEDIKAAFGPVVEPSQPDEQQEGHFYIFITIVGITIGCCCACILTLLYSCIKGCCQRCYKKYFPPDNPLDLVQEEITQQPYSERKQKLNRSNKISQNFQMSERLDNQNLSNAGSTEQNITK